MTIVRSSSAGGLGLALLAGMVVVLFSGCERSLEVENAAGVESMISEPTRHIDLDGQSNFRDLGGYETADGRTVKWGQVYRSGHLARLSDEDVAKLDELGVRTVISFLTLNEIASGGADRVPEGVEEVSLPIDTKAGLTGMVDDLIDARKTGDFSKVRPEVNPEIHRVLVSDAREEYASLLRTIAGSTNGPVVFHCSHGVHRTGTFSAILLSVLGVPWETVREDYILSNECRSDEVDRRLGELRQLAAIAQGVSAEEVDTASMDAFYILQGSYLDASLEQIVADYGSMDAYVREGLGITDQEVAQLRQQLLESDGPE